MIKIKRDLIYKGDVQEKLLDLRKLELSFEDSVMLNSLVCEIEDRMTYYVNAFYQQIMIRGGDPNGLTKPPYYTFENNEDQKDFEKTFLPYMQLFEEIENFDIVEIDVYNEDFALIKDITFSILHGIVLITGIEDL